MAVIVSVAVAVDYVVRMMLAMRPSVVDDYLNCIQSYYDEDEKAFENDDCCCCCCCCYYYNY